MFCSISLFSTFFFIMIFFQNHSKLQQIYTFGASRADEMLTCAQTSLFTMVQGYFFQGGRPWGAYRSRGVQIPRFRFSFVFFLKSEIDDSYTLCVRFLYHVSFHCRLVFSSLQLRHLFGAILSIMLKRSLSVYLKIHRPVGLKHSIVSSVSCFVCHG